MCLGDFNDISHHHEKEGGRRKVQILIDSFNLMIKDIRMEDLGANGQTIGENMKGLRRDWTIFS